MQWFMLQYDEETDAWSERPKVEMPKDVELQEYVWRYDGAVLGADVQAESLEAAIEKAKAMAAAS